MISSMYSPEKLQELEAMDNETYQYYFKNGPEPKWTEEQWAELREYQSRKASEDYKKASAAYANMTVQQKAELHNQLKKMEIAAEMEVKRQLAAEALEDIVAMISLS
jgi:predicted site-specific integrase-resolvase